MLLPDEKNNSASYWLIRPWLKDSKDYIIIAVLQFSALIGFSQTYDSTFWSLHSIKRSDSALIADTVLFPNDSIAENYEYSKTINPKWVNVSKTHTYENQGRLHSIYISLQGNHSFVYQSYFEVGHELTLGKWFYENDSTIILNWNGLLSLKVCRNHILMEKYSKTPFLFASPIRMENWRFTIRKNMLIPK